VNWSDVTGAIPAAVVAAVAAAPNGLTSTGQVYVAERRRVPTNDVEAYGRLTDTSPEDLGSVLGGRLLAWDLELRVGGVTPTDAELQAWGQYLRAYFDGRPLGGVTNLVSQIVTGWAFEESPGHEPARELVLTVRFVGLDLPYVTTTL